MSVSIPVTFEFKGIAYKGTFTDALGPNNLVWFLSVNNYHWGQLMYSAEWGRQFYNFNENMLDYSDYFGDVVMAWYQ